MLNEIVLFKDFIEAVLGPFHRAFLCDTRSVKHFSFLGISRFTEAQLEILHILEVVVLDLLLFNANLHLSQLNLHAIQPVPQLLLLLIQYLKLLHIFVGILHGISNVFVLDDSHLNSRIL